MCEYSSNWAIVIYWLKLHVVPTENEIKEQICGLAQTLRAQNPLKNLISAAWPTATELANLVASCEELFFVIFANEALVEYVPPKLRCSRNFSFQDKSVAVQQLTAWC